MRRRLGVTGVTRVHRLEPLYRAPTSLRALERDLFTPITRPRLLPLPLPVRTLPGLDLRPVEDRRTYHPLGRNRPALSISGRPHSLSLPRSVARAPGFFLPGAVVFRDAPRISICVRRKRRKEVIFALGRNGRGGSFRKPRRNQFSDVECR